MRYEAELREIDFDTLTEGMNVQQKLSKLYEILEKVTAFIFIKKKEFIENEEDLKEQKEKKRSKNKIPKDIRLLMRQKREVSERIKNSNHWLCTLRLTEGLEAKEDLLTEMYKKRKIKFENEAIERHK